MLEHGGIHGAAFDDAALRCDVSKEDGDAAGRRIRALDIFDDVMIEVLCLFQVFPDRLAGDGHQRIIDEAFLLQLLHHCLDTAGAIQIDDMIRSGRGQLAQIWCGLRDLIDDVEVELDLRFLCDGKQMQHGIG